MEKNIEEIILSKDYNTLNNAELAAVSAYISSAEEYRQVRALLLKLKTSEEEMIKPDPAIINILTEKFQRSSSLKVLKAPDSRVKKNKLLFQRLSYAALIAAGLIITFLLIKISGKKEDLVAIKPTHKEQKLLNKHPAKEITDVKEQKANPTLQNNNNNTFSIIKQAAILKNDTITQNHIAMTNTNITQNQITKKGRTLSDDLAVTDVMYVAL